MDGKTFTYQCLICLQLFNHDVQKRPIQLYLNGGHKHELILRMNKKNF